MRVHTRTHACTRTHHNVHCTHSPLKLCLAPTEQLLGSWRQGPDPRKAWMRVCHPVGGGRSVARAAELVCPSEPEGLSGAEMPPALPGPLQTGREARLPCGTVCPQANTCPAARRAGGRQLGCEGLWLLPSRADLVPTYSFGENEVYKQVIFEEGSWGRWVQKKFQKYIGFAPCIFHGRGLFSSDTWGLVPYSKPITTVGELPLPAAPELGVPHC